MPTYFVLDFLKIPNPLIWAAITGLLYNLGIYICLVFVEANHQKRFVKLKAQIDCDIFYEFNGNLRLTQKVENCYICFCDKGVVFISVEKRKPRFFKIPRDNIYTIECDNNNNIFIKTRDKLMYPILCSDIDALSNALYNQGWLAEFEANKRNEPLDEESNEENEKNEQ